MRQRTDLSAIFREILGTKYKKYKVYFQPPASQKMEYPCIRYEKTNYSTDYADDLIYRKNTHYTVTLIGFDPDNDDLIDRLLQLQYWSFDRRYIADNLYHDVFDLYY